MPEPEEWSGPGRSAADVCALLDCGARIVLLSMQMLVSALHSETQTWIDVRSVCATWGWEYGDDATVEVGLISRRIHLSEPFPEIGGEQDWLFDPLPGLRRGTDEPDQGQGGQVGCP
jgi:hypothetical protein